MVIFPSQSERLPRPPEILCPNPNGYRVIELRRPNDGNLLAEIQEAYASVYKWLNGLPSEISLEADGTCACAVDRARPVHDIVSVDEVHLGGLNFQRHRHNFCRVLDGQRIGSKQCPCILEVQKKELPIFCLPFQLERGWGETGP